MPAKDIKELRQKGKLQEAFDLAKTEMDAQPDNIWSKRNMSWVLYDYLKLNASSDKYDLFKSYLEQLFALHLPADEKMLFDQLSWQIGKMIFALQRVEQNVLSDIISLFNYCKDFHFSKPSEGYSFLFKAFHKAFKADAIYLDFSDWWDFRNFRVEDHKKEIIPNLKDPIMSVAEQGFIAYAKHLVPKQLHQQDKVLDKNKVLSFLTSLDDVIESYPEHQYLPYFKAKLLLALGETENSLSAVLPFARKKRNDFWVWEVLSEAFPDDEEKKIACYCKALSCKAADDFLINLRQKMANWFIDNKMFDEAKTEIEFVIKAREANEWKIPPQINNWLSQTWYTSATSKTSNIDYYKKYLPIADDILYQDVPQETVIVDFVNTNKKILNFIASESKFGFFKYDRFIKDVQVGDILSVRFQGGSNQGVYQAYTVTKISNEMFRKLFLKEVKGKLNIPAGKPFGFLDDVFVHPAVVLRDKLTDGMDLKGQAIKSYNQDKKQWRWKFI